MAQTGYTPILIYSSSTASQAPSAANLTNSTLGSELAINITDGKLFYKDNGGSVQVIAWKVTPTTAGGTGLTSYTAGDLLYYATGTTLSKLGIGSSGYWLGSSGTAPQWNTPAALTKTDDTNVTLTLGGSASTALLNAASLTLGWTGQLAVTRGGTGLSTVTQGDLLYASASNTLSALPKNTTATRYLSNTGTSNNPAWAQIDLGNGITGTLPVANGGTGQTSYTNGQLLIGNATGNTLTKTTLTAGSGIGITNGAGSITIANNQGPAFSAYQDSSQTVANNTWTKVNLQVLNFDTNSNFATSRFTPTVAGYYQINGQIQVQTSTDNALIDLYQNGSSTGYAVVASQASTYYATGSIGKVLYFNGSTDYVELYVYQATGGNASMTTVITQMTGTFVRGA